MHSNLARLFAVGAVSAVALTTLGVSPQASADPGQSVMIFKGTGHGPTYNITIDNGTTVRTIDAPSLPYAHTEALVTEPGKVYQIVITGKGDAQAGCEIEYNGHVVVSHPVGDSAAHCVFNS
jgi:hypothetical protein